MENIRGGAPPPMPLSSSASVDTVELFMRRPPKGLRKRLERALGRRIRIVDCYDRTGRWQGVEVPIPRPNRAAIAEMADLVSDRQLWCCASRVDVAVDFHVSSRGETVALATWLNRHVILKWRSPMGRKQEWDGDGFWVLWAGEHRPRDLVVYIKSGGRVRLELKFQSPSAVRRAGLDKLLDLETLDFRKLVRHNIKAEGLTDRYITSVVRKTIKEETVRHRASKRRGDHPVADLYRSKIAARVRRMLTQVDMQEVRPRLGSETVSMDWLGIPERPRFP